MIKLDKASRTTTLEEKTYKRKQLPHYLIQSIYIHKLCLSMSSSSKMNTNISIFLFISIIHIFIQHSSAVQLSTNGRWIVNEAGQRTKLACVNWPSHLEVMVAEGLNKQTLDKISSIVRTTGFNCVRLTWAIQMITNNTYLNMTVRESLVFNGLNDAMNAVSLLNPEIIDLPLIQAFQVK